ncbi:MAG: M3 family metallopeptidase [Bacteroidales bacterium]|nr:M3 family metallopeptidase [Bacteroidales bacterium]MDT8430822.1 M3 family metallopeptidase [Bacteroidales bacterium]
MNPLLAEFDTPFGVPPFDLVAYEHYMPAFKKTMELQNAEIGAIINNNEAPTFENTVAALDYSGARLDAVSNVFYNIKSANTSDEMQAIARELVPLRSAHSSNINLNADLFERIKTVYDQRDALNLNREQEMLLEKFYKQFVRSGASLDEEDKANMRKIDEELSMLSLRFGDNLLEETNNYQLVIDNREDLAGLPDGVIASAAEAAKSAGMEAKWVFTLHKPSWIPFLTYADKRELREEIYKAMYNRGNRGNENDNKEIINKTIKLRTERAKLLGYESHADFVLEERMSKTGQNVYDLLMKLWTPAVRMAKEEAAMMQDMIVREGGDFELASWDWWYYAEKIRKEKYDLDDEKLREYFSLEDVTTGVLDVIHQLYGITFERRDDIPVYHPDVIAYELKDKDGSHMGVQYMDFYPRPGKNSGAWSTSYRKQHVRNGENISTVGSIVCNFSKPSGGKPALISFDEAMTFFHEMGHALHGQFSDCTYPGISGTSVPRDFVELPSQIMENWGEHPRVLKTYAKHYQTGAPIPDEMLQKLEASSKFNMGFVTTEYLAAAILDMDYHTITQVKDLDVNTFEKQSMEQIGLIEEIIPRYKSTYFSHIFSGGYSAGYYSYIWSEVLDKDAFNAFVESGDLFNQELAASFRENILSQGGTREAMEMYLDFRGQEPDETALLKARGLD